MRGAEGAGGGGGSPPLGIHRDHFCNKRLAIAHSNAASPFGGLRSVSGRQTQTRRYLAEVLEANEVVGVVEARGTLEDITCVVARLACILWHMFSPCRRQVLRRLAEC